MNIFVRKTKFSNPRSKNVSALPMMGGEHYDAALAMGRDLMEQVVTIVKPKTILAW